MPYPRSIMHSGAYYPKQNIRCEGQSRIYTQSTDSGNAIAFHVCPTCGTSVFWDSDKYPDRRGIAVGCFADPTFPAPVRSIWEESMHPWLRLPPGIEHVASGIGPDGQPTSR